MKNSFALILAFILVFQLQIQAQEVAQWRGENRDGIYNETGLLKAWPADGPKLLWHYDKLGPGHASASVTEEMIYTAGTTDEGIGFVVALSHSGEKLWQTEVGEEWMDNWEGARSTPLIFEGKLYVLGSYGKLVCLNAKDGSAIWHTELFSDYDGRNIKWGITENLLIDENKLFVVPGGIEANMLALDKDNGKLIWKSSGKKELSAYCSPMIVQRGGFKILVTQTTNSILGIDASSGKLLWNHDHPNKWSVQANTPIYKDGDLYCFSGYGMGGVLLQISDDGKSITEKWFNESLDSKMGGAVLIDGHIYGSGDYNKEWYCVDWETGKDLYSSKELKVGNIIYADGLLYCYGTGGKVGISDPKTNDFSMISIFKVPFGEKYHWAHLVIHNKRLYVRHGTSLMVYDLAAE